MKYLAIQIAISEAECFLRAARAVKPRRPYLAPGEKDTTKPEERWIDNGKDSGTLRRASMDLTRALAEMRKP